MLIAALRFNVRYNDVYCVILTFPRSGSVSVIRHLLIKRPVVMERGYIL